MFRTTKTVKLISLALVLVTLFSSLSIVSSAASSKIYYTLTYDANGGSGAPAPKRMPKNKIFYISKTIPVRRGYSFLGWGEKNSREAIISPGDEAHMDRNYTIYAVWKKGSVRTNYAKPLTNGKYYYISPACASKSVFDVKDWSTSMDTKIQIWKKQKNQENQHFRALDMGNGYYMFVDQNSGLAIDVHGGLTLNGQRVSTWTADGNDAQLFRLIPAGDGYYYIQSKLNGGAYCLDVYKGNSSNGTAITLYQYQGSENQKFKFTSVYGAF